mmetsp:Transcript_20751/g.31685  ORF Transcript_20751/g.31685 Transcript_20751/m.31685 type:complete len:183 (-) Transcript_20751:83-631(-)|eukprot:CAMPEP_0118697804 /NCGR_PEP_ID=MMETSP0800-20121206/14765_1 /TAXON_ID=210618 ORGANISM="Striatella unipunctata, Strain CCMP2910" /NCGR_SAMPLE_ID=MMETSP0800 /ASSEMBLY_ACC=CAM_ASM_000638 /LENGTH=182 /DNA_ID=CAMNT_0006597387 /DNA_START=229 /DNA_END=777 /DNA_ORIENTATION=+
MSRLMRPPYVDPQTRICYDTDNPEFEGWLTKQSMWLKDWRRRYFILKGNKLFFCKDEYSSPHGMIDLAHCITVKSADLKSKRRNSFEISTPDMTYLLYANTEKEKDDWIGGVGRAIVRCSSTYYANPNAANKPRAVGAGGGFAHSTATSGHAAAQMSTGYGNEDDDDDDDYSVDPNNPYFND